jgi:predicted DNA-binding protein with PD1-like motif
MISSKKDNIIIARYLNNEDLFEGLKELCSKHDFQTAVVLSSTGMLKQAELCYFVRTGNYAPKFFAQPMELCCISGMLSKQDGEYHFHLHAALADGDKKVFGGHLSKAKVNVTCELVLMETGLPVERKMEESTGLMALGFPESE